MACNQKQYKSEPQAEAAARIFARQCGIDRFTPYYCKECDAWHLRIGEVGKVRRIKYT